MLSDIRFALRRLRSAPLFFFFAVLTLGLGIGVTTATYSALHRTFWRSLGIADSESVYWITQADSSSRKRPRPMSPLDLRDLREGQTVFNSLEATASFPGAVSANGKAALVSGEAVSGGYFSALGVRPLLGRFLQPIDDDPSAPAAAVVSETFWRRHFAADPGVIGSPIRVGGRVFELVGVAPPRFNGISGTTPITDVWVPLAAAESVFVRWKGSFAAANRNRGWVTVFGRLAPGKDAREALAQLLAVGRRLDAEAPLTYRETGGRVVNLQRNWTLLRVGDRFNWWDNQMMRLMLLVPALVLLIACTNLTNLVLSRGSSRAHEFAVCRALGCSRWDLIRGQLIEVGAIAVAGATAGVAIATGLLGAVDAMVTDISGNWPRLRIDFTMEPALLAAVLAAALLALLVSGLAPAFELTRSRRSRALGVDSPGSAPPRWRGRSNLIALQVAGSVALFLMSSFFVREILHEQTSPSGMDLERVALVNVPFDAALKDEAAARRAIARMLEELNRTPGVDAAAAAVLWDRPARISLARVAAPDGRVRLDYYEYVPATGAAFDVLGLPVLEGRTFFDSDDAGSQPVAVISEALALAVFGTRHAVGRELPVQIHIERGASGSREMHRLTVVGIASNTYDRRGRPRSKIYVPYGQHFASEVDFIARSSTLDDRALAMAVRTAAQKTFPDVPVGYAGSAGIIEGMANRRVLRLVTVTSVGLATFALLLATGGLFGVLTHVMSQRRRELGIRAALGADRARIRNLVLREGIRPVVEGAIIGLGGAVVMGIVTQSMFQRTSPQIAPATAVFAIVPLILTGAVACYIPARRASRLDPSVCLRNE